MTISRLFGSSLNAPSTSASRYVTINGQRDPAWTTDASTSTVVVPMDCTISDLRLQVENSPGVGKSWTLTLHKNGSATDQTVEVSGYGTNKSSRGAPVSFTAGDTAVLEITPSGTPSAPGVVYWSMQVESVTTGESMLIVAGTSNTASQTRYYGVYGSTASVEGNAANFFDQVCPTAGTISKLRVACLAAPDTGKSYTYTLYKNGSSTGLTATIGAGETSATNLTTSVSVAQGDLLEWRQTHSNSPANTAHRICAVFTADNPDVFPIFATCGSNNLPTNATVYNEASGKGRGSWTVNTGTNEVPGVVPGPITIESMTTLYKAAPGSGNSRVMTLVAGSSDAIATTTSDSTTVSTSSGPVEIAKNERIVLRNDRINSASQTLGKVGFAASTVDQEVEEPETIHDLVVYTVGDSWAAWSAHAGSNTGTGEFPLWYGVTFQNMCEGMGSNGVYGATFSSGGLSGITPAGYSERGLLYDRAILHLPENVGLLVHEHASPGSRLAQWAEDIPTDETRYAPASGLWRNLAPELAAAPDANTSRLVFVTLTGNDFGSPANSHTLVPRDSAWDTYWDTVASNIRTVLDYIAELAQLSGAPIEVVWPSYHNFYVDDGNMIQYPPHANNRAPKRALWTTQGFGAFKQWDVDATAEINRWAAEQASSHGSFPENTTDYWRNLLNAYLAADVLSGTTQANSLHPGFWPASTANITGEVINGELQRLDEVWDEVAEEYESNEWVRPIYLSVWDQALDPDETVPEGPLTTTPDISKWVEGAHLNDAGFSDWIDVWFPQWMEKTSLDIPGLPSEILTGQLWPRPKSNPRTTGQMWPR